jgi:hypothetical protein
MSSLEARAIRGCRVQELVDEDVRRLLSVELAFGDGSWLTLGCGADGVSLQADAQPMRWGESPERGHVEVHSRHALCELLRPGRTIAAERPLVGAGEVVLGIALETCDDVQVYVFNWYGDLHYARELAPEIAQMIDPQPSQ